MSLMRQFSTLEWHDVQIAQGPRQAHMRDFDFCPFWLYILMYLILMCIERKFLAVSYYQVT